MTSSFFVSDDDLRQIEQIPAGLVNVLHKGKEQFGQILAASAHLCLQVVLINKFCYAMFSELLFPKLNRYQLDLCERMMSTVEGRLTGAVTRDATIYRARDIQKLHCVGKVAMCWYTTLALKSRGFEVCFYDTVDNERTDSYWAAERNKFQRHFDELLGLPFSRAEVNRMMRDGHSRDNVISPHACCGPMAFGPSSYGTPFPVIFDTTHNGFKIDWIVANCRGVADSEFINETRNYFLEKTQPEVTLVYSTMDGYDFPHRYNQGQAKSAMVLFPAGSVKCGSKNALKLAYFLARVRLVVGPDFKLTLLSFLNGEGLNSPTPAQMNRVSLFGDHLATAFPSTRRDRQHRVLYDPAPVPAWDHSFGHVSACSEHKHTINWNHEFISGQAEISYKVWSFDYLGRRLPKATELAESKDIPVITNGGVEYWGQDQRVLGCLSAVLKKDEHYFWFQVVVLKQADISYPSPETEDRDSDCWRKLGYALRIEGLTVSSDNGSALSKHVLAEAKAIIAAFYSQFHAMTGVEWDQREQANKPGLWHFVHHWKMPAIPVAHRGGILQNRDRSPKRSTPKRDTIIVLDE